MQLVSVLPHTMTVLFPTSLPPPDVQDKALSAILSSMVSATSLADRDRALQLALAISARQTLRQQTPSLVPLKYLLARSHSEQISTSAVLDAIIAYPTHTTALQPFLSSVFGAPGFLDTVQADILPGLASRLRNATATVDIAKTLRILLSVARAHQKLLDIAMAESHYLVPTLRQAYSRLPMDKAGLGARSDALLICHMMCQTVSSGEREALKRLMGDGAGPSKRPLVEANLRGDYEAIFESLRGLQQEQIVVLQSLRDEQALLDTVS